MKTYSVRGFTAATAATANHCIAQLWNASTTRRIQVVEIGLFKTGATGASGDSIYVTRSTARGTAGSTVTPDIDNDWDHDLAPASGSLLDLAAFSSQPTLASPELWGWTAANVVASGVIWPAPRGIWVGQTDGLAICQRVATAWPTSEVYFIWQE